MNESLSQHKPKLLDGQEPFHGPGAGQALKLLDYWRWSGSGLLDNTSRGVLAEFLVAAALDLHKKPRVEWEEHDLCTASGSTIEVKSAAYVQSWKQSKRSVIRFGIAPHSSWDPETGKSREAFKRWADIYVFCVFHGEEPLEPLDTSKWDFYVLPTETLNRKCPDQKSIGLGSLKNLSPARCDYANLKKTIEDVSRTIKRNP